MIALTEINFKELLRLWEMKDSAFNPQVNSPAFSLAVASNFT